MSVTMLDQTTKSLCNRSSSSNDSKN